MVFLPIGYDLAPVIVTSPPHLSDECCRGDSSWSKGPDQIATGRVIVWAKLVRGVELLSPRHSAELRRRVEPDGAERQARKARNQTHDERANLFV